MKKQYVFMELTNFASGVIWGHKVDVKRSSLLMSSNEFDSQENKSTMDGSKYANYPRAITLLRLTWRVGLCVYLLK